MLKMKTLAFLIFLWMASEAQMIETDKMQHLGVGFIIGGVTGTVSHKPIRNALLVSAIAGVGKETHDVIKGYKFDLADAGFTILGGLVAGVIVKQIRHLKHKRK